MISFFLGGVAITVLRNHSLNDARATTGLYEAPGGNQVDGLPPAPSSRDWRNSRASYAKSTVAHGFARLQSPVYDSRYLYAQISTAHFPQ